MEKKIYFGAVIALALILSMMSFSSAWTTADCLGVGGDVTIDGNYCVNTYQTSSQFFVNTTSLNVNILIIAGGGGGAMGGGGAGGLIYNLSYIVNGTININVGAGGIGSTSTNSVNGQNGSNSSFGTLSARGGGGGGANGVNGEDGGSGGGGGASGSLGAIGGLGTLGQGNNGGAIGFISLPYPSGAGGGANSTGQDGQSDSIAGNGGSGKLYDINGSMIQYACGGGGGTYSAGGTAGTSNCGGNGFSGGGLASSGFNGTGGGGGGAGFSGTGGNGGSGIVIVRYLAGSGGLSVFDNVVNYYDFNSSKEIIKGINNLTSYSGTPTYPSLNCLIGKCGRITTSDIFKIPANNVLNLIDTPNNSSTLNFWFKIDNVSQNNGIMGRGDTNLGYFVGGSGTTFECNGYWTGNSCPPNSLVSSNIWYMVTYTRNSSGYGKIYYDGNLLSEGQSVLTSENTFYILGFLGAWAGGSYHMNGYVDELGIWNISLSQSDITNLYNDGNGLAFSSLGEASTFNLTSEMNSPVDNVSVNNPVNFVATLFVQSSNITNATLYIWNASDNSLVLTDFKTENIVNTSAVETWTEILPVNKSYIWNVKVCAVNGQCIFDEENEIFSVVETPIIITSTNHLIHGSGDIFNILNSIGVGFAIFLQMMGIALPFLLIELGIVGVVVAIGFGIVHIVRVSMNR